MKLLQQGARRNTKYSGTKPKTLAATRDGTVGSVSWNEKTQRVEVTLRGFRGDPSEYEYTIQLSADEVGRLVRNLVAELTDELHESRLTIEELRHKRTL